MGKGVRISKTKAQDLRCTLQEKGFLDTDKKALRDGDFVIFPIAGDISGEYDVVEAEFEDVVKRKGFNDHLEDMIGQKARGVKIAFDMVGDLAVVEVPEEHRGYGKEIGEALLKTHRNLKVAVAKSGDVKGETRLRKLEHLAGDKRTETVYQEHGIRLKMDLAKVYFSPRLSYERKRVLDDTKDGEVIADLFAGVGPFAILLAKYRDVKVHAMDINQDAVDYLKENLVLNKVEDSVEASVGDAGEIAPRGLATRVIMNLPKSSDEFLEVAFDVIKEGIIHFYTIANEEDLFDGKIKLVEEMAQLKSRKIKILNKRVVRPYSPRNYHIVLDIKVFS
jgi:tRNA (guanine37-N1)-methyltransferase